MNVEKAFAKIDEAEIATAPATGLSKVNAVIALAPVPPYAVAIEQAASNLGRTKPDHLWKYLDGEGNLVFATARWNDVAGKKDRFFPISWVRFPDGTERFTFKHQNKPWPENGGAAGSAARRTRRRLRKPQR
jgi:hypothetical protein